MVKNSSRNEAFVGHQHVFFCNENAFIKGFKSVSQMHFFISTTRSSPFFFHRVPLGKKNNHHNFDEITWVICNRRILKEKQLQHTFHFSSKLTVRKVTRLMSARIISSILELPIEIIYRILDNLDQYTLFCAASNVSIRLNRILGTYDRYQVRSIVIIISDIFSL